jgi:ribosome recycling factor
MEPIQKKRKIQTVKIDMELYDNLSNRSFELDALKSKYESDMSSLKKEKEISEKLLKDKTVSEDDERRAQDEVQKLTDKFVAEIDKLVQEKEKEVMTV